MKSRKWVVAMATSVVSMAAWDVHALVVGEATSRAYLGEALRVSIPLTLTAQDDVGDGCPQAVILYGDRAVDAGMVILGVSPQTGAKRTLTVRAIEPIDEPLIEVQWRYGCEAPVKHKLTVFANPPAFTPAVAVQAPAVVAPPPAPASHTNVRRRGSALALADAVNGITVPREAGQRAIVEPAPVSAAPRPAPAVAPKAQPASKTPTSGTQSAAPVPVADADLMPAAAVPVPDVVATTAEPSRPRPPSVVLKPPAPPSATPRLVLDPIVPMMLGLPGAGEREGMDQMLNPVTGAAHVSDVDRLQAQLAQDRQRLDEMERLVDRLREDASKHRQAVGVQATVPMSDLRHPAWLVGLSAVAVGLLLSCVYLYARLRRQERATAWWVEA